MANEIAGSQMLAASAVMRKSAEYKQMPLAQRPSVAASRQEIAARQFELSGSKSDRQPDRKNVEEAVVELTERVQKLRTSVRFNIDEEAEQLVVKVVDIDTDETILQLPPEHVLELAKFFGGDDFGGSDSTSAFSSAQGLLFDDKV